MVDVFMDKRLPDYFVEQAMDDVKDVVMENFLDEKIVCLRGFAANSVDFGFLGRVKFPQTWEMKKFRFDKFLEEQQGGLRPSPAHRSIREDVFEGNGKAAKYFVAELRKLSAIIDRVLVDMLAGYHTSEIVKIARFSETRMENLHYDLDPGADDHEAFRFYINIDSAPRIWSTSYQMTDLAGRLAAQCDLSRFADAPSESLAKEIVTRAFGGWNDRASDRAAPRHLVYFDPGDVWVVDGRSVSHQVMYGHRVVSIYAKLPHATNPGLKRTYRDKLRAAVAAPAKEAQPVPIYAPGEVTAAPNVKATWGDVFGTTGTGRIRRFDHTGFRGS